MIHLIFLTLITCVFSLSSLDQSTQMFITFVNPFKEIFGFFVHCFSGVFNQFIFNVTIILVVVNFMTLLLAFCLSHQLFLFLCIYLFTNFRLIEHQFFMAVRRQVSIQFLVTQHDTSCPKNPTETGNSLSAINSINVSTPFQFCIPFGHIPMPSDNCF